MFQSAKSRYPQIKSIGRLGPTRKPRVYTTRTKEFMEILSFNLNGPTSLTHRPLNGHADCFIMKYLPLIRGKRKYQITKMEAEVISA